MIGSSLIGAHVKSLQTQSQTRARFDAFSLEFNPITHSS
jgi:hypothetical protein